MDRFWSKVDASGDCWLWTASLNRHGYGQYRSNSTMVGAHRYAWSVLVGEIPGGFELDHLCRVRKCVNPDHLEVVTRQENLRRSAITRGPAQAARSHCVNGHPFDEANTINSTRGRPHRICRACRNARVQEWRRRQAA